MRPAQLRRIVFERDGGCVWPGCSFEISYLNPLVLAHLTHRGMGGGETRNTEDNAVTLCTLHHDVFDLRQGRAKAHVEMARMLKTVVGL